MLASTRISCQTILPRASSKLIRSEPKIKISQTNLFKYLISSNEIHFYRFLLIMTGGQFGAAPPACPENLTQYIPYPSIVTIFLVMMLVDIIFAFVCYFRYNSVEVYSKSVRSSKISNTAWVLYFIGISVRYWMFSQVYGSWNVADFRVIVICLWQFSIVLT